MTEAPGSVLLSRGASMLSRDLGSRVLVLPLARRGLPTGRDRADVQVLGGGSATLWRVLQEPMTVSELLEIFGASEVGGAIESEIRRSITQLLELGVLSGAEE